MSERIRFLSLFSGIEAIKDVGWESLDSINNEVETDNHVHEEKTN